MKCVICHDEWMPHMSFSILLTIRQADVCCPRCRARFIRLEGSCCERCSRFSDQAVCEDCIAWEKRKSALKQNVSVYMYNDWMKEVMNRFKFRGDYALVEAFRHDIRAVFSKHFSSDVLLVPIPLSPSRLVERGFNQAEAIASLLPFPIISPLRRIDGEKQSKKTRRERFVGRKFFVAEGSVAGKRIVIVDDIYTTGATVHEAAKLLYDAGAQDICSFTLIRS
ncbi:amidophosphoribosyltransferase [Anoxybacillus ayderensis]|uniref:ComF family protein n=1 Tax=Anoxybacillus sp. ST70 TaxID=2864180 RepID=UPI0002DE4229|nr:ComF family protein [Anoxybacillus sp. ST70]AXM89143.1 ComF family protein [Anoxybacillus ayderensis G10]MBW9218581.1 ComF family protein [Anoxybacillus sp. ST70]THD17758.1 amidophosphoribosyltransferase [Anoxybacillus ayderensis]